MNFPDLIGPIYNAAKRRIKLLPQHTNRASSLGGICEREETYARVCPEKATAHGVDLQLIFEEGAIHEKEVLKQLSEFFHIIEQQVSLEWKEYQITGHIDGLVVWLASVIPLDIKSMSEHIWESIAFRGPGSYEWPEVSEKFTKKPWLRKYLGQITLYALMKNVERGILVLKNKSTGALAQVNVEVDYAYGEELLKRAERINSHIAAETLPDRIPYDPEVCPRCRFYGECLPEQAGGHPLAFVTDARLEELLEQRGACEEAGRDFDRLDREVKAIIKARPEQKMSVGNFLVQKAGNEARTVVKIERISGQTLEQEG